MTYLVRSLAKQVNLKNNMIVCVLLEMKRSEMNSVVNKRYFRL